MSVPGGSWRSWLLTGLKILLAAAITWFAASTLVRQWSEVRSAAADVSPNWWLVAAACAIVLATYGILSDVWRRVIATWRTPVRLLDAFRMWAISSLGRYVPGKVWQLGAIAYLARERGISATAAVGASLIVSAINTAVGFGIVAAFGAHLLGGGPWLIVAIAAGVIGLLLAPIAMPPAIRLAARVLRRPVQVPQLRHSTVWLVVVITTISWIAYGAAFYLLSHALFEDLPGGLPPYVAAYTFSYLLGFLAVFSPGGLVVREVSMAAALVNAGLPQGEAIIIAVASRLWLTVLEIAPALFFLAEQRLRRSNQTP